MIFLTRPGKFNSRSRNWPSSCKKRSIRRTTLCLSKLQPRTASSTWTSSWHRKAHCANKPPRKLPSKRKPHYPISAKFNLSRLFLGSSQTQTGNKKKLRSCGWTPTGLKWSQLSLNRQSTRTPARFKLATATCQFTSDLRNCRRASNKDNWSTIKRSKRRKMRRLWARTRSRRSTPTAIGLLKRRDRRNDWASLSLRGCGSK